MKRFMKKGRVLKKGKKPEGRSVKEGKVWAIIKKYRERRGSLIPVLQEVQEALGYLSAETLEQIAEGLGLPASQVYGVATFYTQFRLKPVGKHLIRVCHGTACHVGGAVGISEALEAALGVKDGQTTADGKFTLESVACLGCCSLAPVMMIDGETYGRLTKESAAKALKDY
jgi:NADH-quinone oxidoreductase subunit E